MLPPPTTSAISTPRLWISASERAIAWTRTGSVPYGSSPIRSSPESLSRTRRKAGPPAGGPCTSAVDSATDLEAGESTNHHVLAGFRGQRSPQVLDLAAVVFGVDVNLTQEHDLVQPAVDLAGHGIGPGL